MRNGRNRTGLLDVVSLILLALGLAEGANPPQPPVRDLDVLMREVVPVLTARCARCHGLERALDLTLGTRLNQYRRPRLGEGKAALRARVEAEVLALLNAPK